MILNKQKQKGFSLLELLLVVAVGAILILAGLAIYSNITNNTNINEATRLINLLKQETQRLYQGETSYGTAGDSLRDILRNADAVPGRYIGAGSIIETPFDSEVDILAAGTGGNDFEIQMTNVPQYACIKLGVEYNNDDPDFTQLAIDGTVTNPSVVDVNAACSAGGSTMTWTFE